MNLPLLFLQCLCNQLLSIYDLDDKKKQALKKLLERLFCYILHWCLVYKLKQPFNWVKLQRNSQLHAGSLELGSAVVTIEFLLTSLSKASFPQVAHFGGAWKSPGHSKVILFIFRLGLWYTPVSDTRLEHCIFPLCQSVVIWIIFKVL